MMEAKKRQQIQKIEQMIGKPFLYRGREVKIQTYAVADGQVRIINQGNTITFPYDRLDEELDNFLPVEEDPEDQSVTVHQPNESEQLAKAQFQGDSTRLGQVEDVLMDNIKKLQDGEVDIDTAKEINNSVKTMIDASKQKLKMVQEIRKAKQMGS